jgi:hypothetical protein
VAIYAEASSVDWENGSADRDDEADIPGPRVRDEVGGRGTASPGRTNVISA